MKKSYKAPVIKLLYSILAKIAGKHKGRGDSNNGQISLGSDAKVITLPSLVGRMKTETEKFYQIYYRYFVMTGKGC